MHYIVTTTDSLCGSGNLEISIYCLNIIIRIICRIITYCNWICTNIFTWSSTQCIYWSITICDIWHCNCCTQIWICSTRYFRNIISCNRDRSLIDYKFCIVILNSPIVQSIVYLLTNVIKSLWSQNHLICSSIFSWSIQS